MKRILDIHAHLADQKRREDSLYSLSFPLEKASTTSFYSLGIHPWYISSDINWEQFEAELANPNILAIGECGLDKLQLNTTLEDQIACFSKQIALSEKHKKPLIIHLVKAIDELIKLHKAYKPTQKWIVHGFRGNPKVYQMLINQGIRVSLGPQHNSETLKYIPLDQLLVETDTTDINIEEVCGNIAKIKNISTQELIHQIYKNTSRILFR